jgi:rfaE bifunctional protein nucleotidyltransferase chain/domain
MRDKILPLSELERIAAGARAEGKKVVLCHGVFDLMHPGHVLHFKAARRLGDVLLVTITPDDFVNKGPGRPVFPQALRLETIAALEYVDYVALNEWPTAVETINRLKPDLYVKGSEYANASDDVTGKIVDEANAVKRGGGRIEFTHEPTFSSSNLINRYFSRLPARTETYLKTFRERFSAKQVVDLIQSFSDLDVLVVGEAILDQYCYCHPMGKAAKDTNLAARYVSDEDFAGGSLAIANHIAGFARKVTLVTTLGTNQGQWDFIRSRLRSNVEVRVVTTKDRPTITKRRYVEPLFLGKLFEVQWVPNEPLPADVEEEALARVTEEIPRHDFTLVCDFGHGLLTERIREAVCASDKFIALNTQTNSANFGFNFTGKYSRANYVCLHEGELRLSLRAQYGDVPALARKLRDQTRAKVLTVTRSSSGSLTLTGDGASVETPAFSMRAVDRVGAGDAYFAVTALGVYKGLPPEVTGFLGNCVGALAVEIVCNREPVDPVSLKKFVTSLLA